MEHLMLRITSIEWVCTIILYLYYLYLYLYYNHKIKHLKEMLSKEVLDLYVQVLETSII